MLAILVVETNRKNKSDYIYLKKYMGVFFDIGSDIIRPVYLKGKTNYNDSARIKEIQGLISDYKSIPREDNRIAVLYFIDTDDISRGPNANKNKKLNSDIKRFCKTNGFEFVWFHEVIEQVFIGTRVPDKEKKAFAERFASRRIYNFNRSKLCYRDCNQCIEGSSNIDLILKNFFSEKTT